MSNPVGRGLTSLVRAIGPARLRQWSEWLVVAACIACGVALALYNSELSDLQRVAGWSLLALILANLFRRGWVRLFGPVLLYDLVRNARRTRTFVMRCAYLLLLSLFLWSFVGSRQMEARPANAPPDPKKMAALAEAFFYTFMGVQFGLAVFLTPAYVASAITEEKERKTLEYLLATDLDSREIILGKLIARLGNLTLLLLTGLPVLSAVQFMGGVAPDLVLAGFAATAVTAAGLAGMSMLASVYARRSRDAIMLTYLAAGVYLALCALGSVLANTPFALVSIFPGGPTLADCVQVFQAGNPLYALYKVIFALTSTGAVQAVVSSLLLGYATFHILLAVTTVTLAIVRLRPVALREAAGPKKGPKPRRQRRQRAIGDHPMVWKELHRSGGMRSRRWGLILTGLLVALSYAPVPFIIAETIFSPFGSLAVEMNAYVRIVGTVVACLSLLSVAVLGSVAVRIERDKDTLDALLTSPLTTREILFGKWVGCLWSLRWPGLWLGSIYALGVFTGGLSLFAVPLLIGAILAYSGTLTTVGLWFSVVCRTTVRATVVTVFTCLGMALGHWMLWLCCLPVGITAGSELEAVAKLQAGITPPFVLGAVLPFGTEDRMFARHSDEAEMFSYALIGTFGWAVLGLILWVVLNDRFQNDVNRADIIEPDGADPASGQQQAGDKQALNTPMSSVP